MSKYKSCFAEAIQGIIHIRETLGYSSVVYEEILASFDDYCVQFHPGETVLTEHLVMPWIINESGDLKGVQNRATIIRKLGQYINASGSYAYVLPERLFGKSKPKDLYTLTDDDLKRLFREIDHLPEASIVPYSHMMLPVLFRLIYTCGLRPREGRELKRKNINLNSGEILITKTKKKKERIVVMSDDMLALCRRYERMRQFFYEDNDYFFPGNENGPIEHGWLNRQFLKCWSLANPEIPRKQLPVIRIYDLRHRFASCNLNRWLDEGKDLTAMLPRLRFYMGHDSFSETEHYIHLLPENLVKNKGIDWNAFSDIIPEVSPWEE